MDPDFDVCPDIAKSAPSLLHEFTAQLDAVLAGSEVEVSAIVNCVEQFQEAPQLLDTVIESSVKSIAKAYLAGPAEWQVKVLYALIKVRGPKTVARFFPNDVSLILRVLDDLEAIGDKHDWEERYVLLVWMSLLTLTPFKLASIAPDLAERVYDVAKRYVVVSGKERDAAADVLARFLARADTFSYLSRFLDDGMVESTATVFATLGWAATIAALIPLARPSDLEEHMARIEVLLDLLKSSKRALANSQLRKLLSKATYRLALAALATSPSEIPRSVETCIDDLLNSTVSDKDTVVRYSASKAIARIAVALAKIDPELVSQIVDGVFGIFEGAGADRVHGGLLSVAELLRRHAMPMPTYADQVNKVVALGLRFEVRKSTHAMGSNVRDAACYVAWSLFRHYPNLCSQSPSLVKDILSELVLVGCFDREINNRRAAAAAVQECIGRHACAVKDIETGIELVQAVEYFGIGNRQHAFLDVSLAVQRLDVTGGMVDCLLDKIKSWDADIRRLAARALALVAAAENVVHAVMARLLASLGSTLEEWHGSLFALGELLDVVPAASVTQSFDIFTETAYPAHESLLRYESALRLISSAARIYVERNEPTPPSYLEILENALSVPDDGGMIYSVASQAARYLPVSVNHFIERAREGKPGFVVAVAKICESADVAGVCDLACTADVTVRVAAVRALQEIVGRDVQVDTDAVVRAVSLGLRDYTILPTRGDVGSQIRAACVEFVTVHHGLFDAQVAPQLVRILFEKIDRLRNAAVVALRALDTPSLRDILHHETVTFTELSGLLGSDDKEYAHAAVTGICGSIGGNTSESVVRSAMDAISAFIISSRPASQTNFGNAMCECIISPAAGHPRREFEMAELLGVAVQGGVVLQSYVPVYNKIAKMMTLALKTRNLRRIAMCASAFGAFCADDHVPVKVRVASMKKICDALACDLILARTNASEIIFTVASEIGDEALEDFVSRAGFAESASQEDAARVCDLYSAYVSELDSGSR